MVPVEARQKPTPEDAAGRRGESPSSAFESFFRAHYPEVVRVAQRVVGDVHLAQDVAQDVLVAAHRRFPNPAVGSPERAHAAGWVRVAAVHAGLNALRGGRRRQDRHLRAASRPGHQVTPEEVVLERATQQDVREALGRLPRRSATVLVLRHCGLSYAEVAESMGIGTGHVGTMLRRAEAAFRKEIEDASRT